MRLLLLTDAYPPYAAGGDGVIAGNLAKGLKKLGNDLCVVCTYKGLRRASRDAVAQRIFTPKALWISSNIFQFSLYCVLDRINFGRLVSRFAPDLIYILHQWGISPPLISWINNLPIPKAYRFGDEWLRLHYYRTDNWRYRLWKRPSLEVRHSIVNSPALAEKLGRFVGRAPEIIYNGVDPELFGYSPKEKFGYPLKLLFVGRAVPHKGLHIALAVLRKLQTSLGEDAVNLTIAGGWPNPNYAQEIRREIERHQLETHVNIVGFQSQEELAKTYKSHDVLIFPSTARAESRTIEGCPSVLLEAWSCGIPVVARATSELSELISENVCWRSEYDEPDAYAHLVLELIANPEVASFKCVAARRLVLEKHSSEQMLTRTQAVLERILRSGGA